MITSEKDWPRYKAKCDCGGELEFISNKPAGGMVAAICSCFDIFYGGISDGGTSKNVEPPKPPKPIAGQEQPIVETWDKEISELEKYFTGITLPTQPVKLDQCSTITNVQRFIESHFATVKEYNGVRSFEPYLDRLKTLQLKLKNVK